MIYLLKSKCPKCGSEIKDGDAVMMGLNDIPDNPDVPWVEVSWDRKRFNTCINGHNFNIRPYGDYDDHYIYEDRLEDTIKKLRIQLADLESLCVKKH